MVLLLAPIEDLDRNIFTLCKHINAATYELLVLIREFDERVGWLAWRCDRRTSVPLDRKRRRLFIFFSATYPSLETS